MKYLRQFPASRLGLAVAAAISASLPSSFVTSPLWLARSTWWLAVETTIALAVTFALGLLASLSAEVRTSTHLDLFVSRGLELAAALPVVLVSAVLVVVVPMPVPVAIGLVVGILGGLRTMRVVATLARQGPSRDADTPGSLLHSPRLGIERAALSSLPTVVEQLIGLEAAIAWLGLLDRTWTGGWGECLGRYARLGDLTHLGVWTLAAVGLSVGLKVMTWHSPALPETQQAP